jgi:hypothetical protein
MTDEWNDIEAKAKAASPGPWTLDELNVIGADGYDIIAFANPDLEHPDRENMEFVVSANPERVLRLIAVARGNFSVQVEELRAALRERDAEIERLNEKNVGLSEAKRVLSGASTMAVDLMRAQLRQCEAKLNLAREALQDITHPNMDPRGPADGAIRIASAALEKIGDGK